MAVQNSRQHERFVEEGVDTLLVRLDTNNAVLRERARGYSNVRDIFCRNRAMLRTIREQPDALKYVLDDDRLEDVQLHRGST